MSFALPQYPASVPPPPDAARAARIVAEFARARAALARAAVVAPAGGISRELMRLAADELRVPATAIGGYLQLILEGTAGPLEPEQEHMIASAAFHAGRMVELVDDLVVIGNLAGRPARFATMDIGEFVRERALAARSRAIARQVRLELRLGDCPPVHGDPALLGRALDCLFDHAISFSPPAATVVCGTAAGPEGVVIEVTDSGVDPGAQALEALLAGRSPGIPDDARTLLASRLGLALVRMVCQAHGGRAEADGADGWTTLRMVLPAVGVRTATAVRGT